MTVSPSVSSGRISTVGPEPLEEARGPATDLVDPGLRVAPAVDVDERGEVLEVGRELVLEDLLELGELVGADGGARRVQRFHPASLATREAARRRAILPGPCASSRSGCSRDPPSTGSSRSSRSSSPSVAGGPGTASGCPVATRSSTSAATVPAARLAGRGGRAGRLGPAAARRSWRGPRRASPSTGRPIPGTGSSRSRGRARSGPRPSPKPPWPSTSGTCRRSGRPASRGRRPGCSSAGAPGSTRRARCRRAGSGTPTGGSRSSRSAARTARAR